MAIVKTNQPNIFLSGLESIEVPKNIPIKIPESANKVKVSKKLQSIT